MPGAPAVHNIATPRRQIGGTCRKWCISTQPTIVYNSATEKHDFNSGAIVNPTMPTSMHTVPTEVLVTQSNPWIRKQLKLSPANVKLSSGQLHTLKSFCPLHRTRIKPPHGRRNHGLPVVRQHPVGQHQGPTRHHGRTTPASVQVCASASTTCYPPCNRARQPLLTASEPAWKALVLSSWLLLGRPPKTGQPSRPWFVLNAMLLQSTAQHGERPQNRNFHAYAWQPHWLDQVKKDEPWLQPETPSHRAECSRDHESLPDRPRTSRSRTSFCVKPFLVRCSESPHHTNLGRSACVLSIGTTLVL